MGDRTAAITTININLSLFLTATHIRVSFPFPTVEVFLRNLHVCRFFFGIYGSKTSGDLHKPNVRNYNVRAPPVGIFSSVRPSAGWQDLRTPEMTHCQNGLKIRAFF